MRFGIREMLYLLVLVGVMVGAYFVALQPMDVQIQKFRDDTASKNTTLEELTAAKAKYPDLDAEIARLTEAMDSFEQKLPSQRDVEIILRRVTEIGSENNLVIKSIKPDKPINAAEYKELPIKLEVIGDFDRYYSFIKSVEEMPRITRMPEMTIEKEQKEGDGIVKTTMTLSIFFEGDRKPEA